MMFAPDIFDADPYGHMTNQAGHALFFGIGLALPFLWTGFALWFIPLAVAVIYAGTWEWGIQRYRYPARFDWRDSLMDTACTTAGASMICGFRSDLLTGSLCWLAWVILVVWGGLRRWNP